MLITEPTDEQKAVLNCDSNVVVTARPGSGKTFTIVEKIAKVLPSLPNYQGIIAISFTNKASFELKKRCSLRGVDLKNSFWGTIDKFYISQIIIPFASHLTGSIPEYRVVDSIDSDSKFQLLHNVSFPFDEQTESLVLDCLSEGLIPLKITGVFALYILNKVPGSIRFLISRYRYVFVDEYQDCGCIQHVIFKFLVEKGLIGIAVGDVNQSIYGFAERFPKYLISLISDKNFEYFELNKNHRCHESISEYSLCLYNASNYIPSETRVYKISLVGAEQEIAKIIDCYLNRIKVKYDISYNSNVAILCRSNFSVERFSSFIKTPCKVFKETELDRDMSEWGRFFRELLISVFDSSTFAVDFVEQYYSLEFEQNLYLKALNLCSSIFSSNVSNICTQEDNILSLAKLIYPSKKNTKSIDILHSVLSSIDLLNTYIPASDEEINIMTLHKSKGLEFDAVFHMDMYKYIIPNEYGDDSAKQQDLNLHYVGITRAKKVCFIMLGDKRYRAKSNCFVSAEESPFLSLPGLKSRRKDYFFKSTINTLS